MPLSLVIKDFLWWLIKENTLVNWAYLKLGKRAFKAIPASQLDATRPLTSKPDYKTAKPASWPAIKGFTSGTTNEPLTVYRSLKSILLEEYMLKTALAQFGVPLVPKYAILRGDNINHSDDGDNFFQKQPFTGRLIMSSYHLGPKTVRKYLKRLEAYRPDVIMAYPSSIYLLAKLAQDANWKPNWPLKCVFTSSETFTPEKQALVREIFGPVCDHYGQAERVAALQTCVNGHYHVREDYSLVEFIPDEHGVRIVGSNVYNKAMPMLRYDTGDYVEGLEKDTICSCGNPSPYVKQILGRDDDYVILPDGRQIGRLDVAFKGIDGLLEAQIEQSAPDRIIIRYIGNEACDHQLLTTKLEDSLKERLGSSLFYEFVPVKDLPRTRRGKFKSVIRSYDIA